MNILSDVFNLHISAECFTYNYNLPLFAALFILVFGLPMSLTFLSSLFQTLSIAEAAESVSMDESESDKCTSSSFNLWMPESLELLKKLTGDLIDHGKGDWIKHTDDLSSSSFNGEKKVFTKAVNSEFPGKFFEYQYFVNKDKRKLKGVVQFGPYTQGTPG